MKCFFRGNEWRAARRQRVYIAKRATMRATEWTVRGHGRGHGGVLYSVCGRSAPLAGSRSFRPRFDRCTVQLWATRCTRRSEDSPELRQSLAPRRDELPSKKGVFLGSGRRACPPTRAFPLRELPDSRYGRPLLLTPTASLAPVAKLSKSRQAAATLPKTHPFQSLDEGVFLATFWQVPLLQRGLEVRNSERL